MEVTLEPLQCLDLCILPYLDNWPHDEDEPDKYHDFLIKCPVEALAQKVSHERNHSTTLQIVQAYEPSQWKTELSQS